MGLYLLPFPAPLRARPVAGAASAVNSVPVPAQKKASRACEAGGEVPGSSKERIGRGLWRHPRPPASLFRGACLSRRRSVVAGVIGGGADVKSETFDVGTDSAVPELVKFVDALQEAAGDEEDGLSDDEDDSIPKRWVIVILCFTAFLLCNMDRVRGVNIYFPQLHLF